jgi:hypothetical protein
MIDLVLHTAMTANEKGLSEVAAFCVLLVKPFFHRRFLFDWRKLALNCHFRKPLLCAVYSDH